jgi:uncharacterized ferritin-like protein (DUF455 family)
MTEDSALFADDPARDPRFDVRRSWSEMVNYSAGDPKMVQEFLHRQMNEEINGMEISARNIADFPDAPWELRMAMARQCWDEARHIQMFRNCLEERGGHVGQYPVMNFQYRIITKLPTLLGRLAVQNRSFEAAGIDAIQQEIVERSTHEGDADLATLFDMQLADEVQHVRYANVWLKKLIAMTGPRAVLDLTRAVHNAIEAVKQVAGPGLIAYPVADDIRREAGFSDEEIEAARSLAAEIG